MSTLDGKLSEAEKKDVINQVYDQLSKDLKDVISNFNNNQTENDQSAQNKMKQLSGRLDKGFYDYCTEKFKDQEVQDIKNAINTALGKFPKNEDLIKLQRFVEGAKTFTDNTKTETFSGTGRLINSMNASPEQKRKLDQDLKDLSNKIDTLDHNTNLYKLLDAMRTVTKTGVGGQNLQYYLYTDLAEEQKANFLAKNAKRGVSRKNIGPNVFDGVVGFSTLSEYIRNTNAKIDQYNDDKEDINSNNAVFNQLMGNSSENTRIINEAISKAEAAKTQKEQAEIEQKKIEAGLQEQDSFIKSFNKVTKLPSQSEMSTETQQKLQKKIADLQEEGKQLLKNNKDEDNPRYKEITDLLQHSVKIYKRILVGEQLQARIDTLQKGLQGGLKPEDLKGTGFEIKNNLVVISSDFEKALKGANLRDPEEITENKSDQRESRKQFETKLINALTSLDYVKQCQNYLKARHQVNNKFQNGRELKQEVIDQRVAAMDKIAEKDGTLAKIQNLESMGIYFNDKGDLKNIDNGVNRSKIQEFINEQKPSSDQQTSVNGGVVTNKPNNPSNKPSEEDNVNTHEGSQSQKGKEVGTQPSVIEAQNVSPEREQKAKDIVSKLNDELKKPKTERDLTLFADDNITLMEVFSGSAEHHNEQSVNISSYTVLQQRNNSEWDFVRCTESDGHLKVYIKPKTTK